ncbi:polynucleotide 5'-hydroxyl-kinase NOL9 isoform X1 [Megalops cyprinoides]|uniref:polynucleotide 5'-hydroxyl-kinase NOL9 isoform X1 n=1 Tax=Megalops cyprinoides TaxID=118141 RepID=UPI0018654BDE|nr:polynucleotide 5'-hydroxyl-kinase NOL9 isoform X1 [Megalops cyprinoides]
MKVPNGSAKVKGRSSGETRRIKKKKRHSQNATPMNSDPSNASPDTAMAKKYYQLASRGKPSLKRLKGSARPVYSGHGQVALQRGKGTFKTGAPPQPHTNGGPELELDSSSEDSEHWSSYARSILQNGMEGSSGQEVSAGTVLGGKGEESPPYHAELDCVHNRAVLVLQQGQTLTFRGKALLTCLYGRVEVLGFTIEEGQQPYPVFSPPTHCPLTVTAMVNSLITSKTRKERRLEAKAIVRKYLSTEPRKRLQSAVDSDSCLVLLEPLDTPLTRFLTSLPEHRELFGLSAMELKSQSVALDCPLSAVGLIPLHGSSEGLVMSQSYRNALTGLVHACAEESDGCPVILVCGAKNTGKSTFNRHLINTLLNHTASVEYLECDLGQTEFTPPGCLSLSTITEPLLGAPFTHLSTPERMVFFGETSCERDLDRYLESLKFLWRSYSRDTPIIINTMGWVKGFGFQLLVDFVRLFSVTHVVQLSYGATYQCPALTPAFLRTAQGWQTRPQAPPTGAGEDLEEQVSPQSHMLLSVQSEFQGAGAVSNMRYHRSNVLRDLALLAYFSQLQSPDPGPVRPLHCFTPYQVPLSAVAVRVTHCEVAPAHVLYAANASLVGLCCLGEKVAGTGGPVLLSHTPVCQCVGFGVLRGVDVGRGLYFLVTPVAPSVLRKVNCLLLGGVTLPHTLLRAQPGIEGEQPYVTKEYSFELTGAGKMRVFKGLVRREHMGGGGH